ncbi:MAG: toprim domain-containing protein [Candidatus Pacearchaeota archaeon]
MMLGLAWDSILSHYHDYVIIVEGKKDAASLEALGFRKVYTVHDNALSLKERAEEISAQISRHEPVCILTDFDRRGKQLYLIILQAMQDLGIRVDFTLRDLLLRARVSHIEGFYNFVSKQ